MSTNVNFPTLDELEHEADNMLTNEPERLALYLTSLAAQAMLTFDKFPAELTPEQQDAYRQFAWKLEAENWSAFTKYLTRIFAMGYLLGKRPGLTPFDGIFGRFTEK